MRLDINTMEFKSLFEDKEQFSGAGPEELLGRGIKPEVRVPIENGVMIFKDIREEEIIYWHELTPEEQKEFDYIEDEEGSFFRYGGQAYDMGTFMRVEPNGDLAKAGWHGMDSSSVWSATVVKLSDDGDGVTVADVRYEDNIGEAKNRSEFQGAGKKEVKQRLDRMVITLSTGQTIKPTPENAGILYDDAIDNHYDFWNMEEDTDDVEFQAASIFDDILATYGLEGDEPICDALYEHIYAGLT